MSLTVHVVAPAPRDATWDVWSDIEGWPRWNPMCLSATLSGDVAEGTQMELQLVHPKGREFYTRPRLVTVDPPGRISWEATAPGLLIATETTLAEEPDGTLVTITSTTSGRMRFSMRLMSLGDRPLAQMYAGMLNALVGEMAVPR